MRPALARSARRRVARLLGGGGEATTAPLPVRVMIVSAFGPEAQAWRDIASFEPGDRGAGPVGGVSGRLLRRRPGLPGDHGHGPRQRRGLDHGAGVLAAVRSAARPTG